jgi:hypothetical protein
LHTGHVDSAIAHLDEALQSRQWFGKIGTDEEDLEAGAMISLAQSLQAKNDRMNFYQFRSWSEHLDWLRQKSINAIRGWWLMRRARQLMAEDLNDLEDLNIRNTDSLIEYSTFGDLLAGFPRRTLERRIALEGKQDERSGALPYYKAYLAENELGHGHEREAFALINEVEQYARPQFDKFLLIRMQLLSLSLYSPGEPDYRSLAQSIFSNSKAILHNWGYALPVHLQVAPEYQSAAEILAASGFYPDDSDGLQYSVSYEFENGDHVLSFGSQLNNSGGIKVRAGDLTEAVNRFTEEVFSEDLETKR